MANILIKQGREIAGSSLVTPSTKADKTDLTDIIQTGTTSSQAISAGKYFYLNDTLVRAKVDIANGATFTLNTNYEVVTAGALNELNNAINASPTTAQPTQLGNISVWTATDNGILQVISNNTTSNAFVYIVDDTSGLALVSSLGYNANVGSFCSANVYKGRRYRIGTNGGSTLVVQFLPIVTTS